MDTQMQFGNQECFVSILERLRESSKEAVASANADFNDPYIQYMHVDRPVQDKFVEILNETYGSDQAELILLCGNVGDGKSHILSYCKAAYPDKMEQFYIHNDSTASLYVDKPASYTLKEIMQDFADDKIESSSKKVILAINLGTLSNFLEADADDYFKKLKQYVEKTGILEGTGSREENIPHFHSINFADYHLYELNPDGISSEYILGILKKISNNTEENIFYRAYCETCKMCPSKDLCPIQVNYRLLSDEKIQQGLIHVLVENIIKNKLLVSTRALLNMIYEVLVDERFWQRGSLEPKKQPQKLSGVRYCEALLPNALFTKRTSSEVLNGMGSIDPMRIRNEQMDDFFIWYENSKDTLEIFKKHLPAYEYLLERLSAEDFSDLRMHDVKDAVRRLFVRTECLVHAGGESLPYDEDYREYVSALYAWNTGNYQNMKNVYSIVEKGILAWNGSVNQDEMQLETGNKKAKYHLIQKIRIKKKANDLPKTEPGRLNSFTDELHLKYRYSDHSEATLDVDFSLYKLLKMIVNGYVPNIHDKRVNVKCVEFIKAISKGGKKMEELYIRDLSQKEAKEYSLSYDEDFGYSFEVH